MKKMEACPVLAVVSTTAEVMMMIAPGIVSWSLVMKAVLGVQ
jgi:hypothetical protein